MGDSLAGELRDDPRDHARPPRRPSVTAALRGRYARASGARKATLGRALDRAERVAALASVEADMERVAAWRREVLLAIRQRDLFGRRQVPAASERERLAGWRRRIRELRAERARLAGGGALPFSWESHFPDVMRRGGFCVVLGNPPWVRLHRIPPAARAALRARYVVFRYAAWERGASLARAGAGFGAQADLAALFVERSVSLLRDGGVLGLLLPAKLWRALAGGGVRRLLAERTDLLALDDWSDSPAAFDAVVYPSSLVARRRDRAARPAESLPGATLCATLRRRNGPVTWEMPREALHLDGEIGAPWLVLPPAARAAFDRVTRAGVPLADSRFGAPTLGVKCGCNAAFVVTVCSVAGEVATVRAGDRMGTVERWMLRPLLRGESLAARDAGVAHAAMSGDGGEHIVWTHGAAGPVLDRLPPLAERWLAPWQRALRARSDVRGGARWWSLFRTGGAAANRARVVWADFGRAPRVRVLLPGDPTVPLNSCYVLPCRDPSDARALAALLHSPLAAAWLNALAEPARGGYHRYLGWTMSLLPIPADWDAARAVLAPLALTEEGNGGGESTPATLLAAATRAYKLRARDVDPLVTWNAG
ncbi:MAG: hypothetical protein WKG32_17660 [Gemmatimonadaceae bacterium]